MSNTPAGDPGDEAEQPDRIPTQAELDAEDLRALEHSSRDRDHANLYPPRPVDPGAPPRALTHHAFAAWAGSAVAGLACMGYGFLNLGTIQDLLRERLLDGLRTDPRNAAPVDRIDSIASVFPPLMLVMIAVFLVIEYLLLTNTAARNSRNLRNFFLATAVINLLCIPVGTDLLFRYDELSSILPIVGWIQFGLLCLAALCSLRRVVDRWLPPSDRMRPTRMFRER